MPGWPGEMAALWRVRDRYARWNQFRAAIIVVSWPDNRSPSRLFLFASRVFDRFRVKQRDSEPDRYVRTTTIRLRRNRVLRMRHSRRVVADFTHEYGTIKQAADMLRATHSYRFHVSRSSNEFYSRTRIPARDIFSRFDTSTHVLFVVSAIFRYELDIW